MYIKTDVTDIYFNVVPINKGGLVFIDLPLSESAQVVNLMLDPMEIDQTVFSSLVINSVTGTLTKADITNDDEKVVGMQLTLTPASGSTAGGGFCVPWYQKWKMPRNA